MLKDIVETYRCLLSCRTKMPGMKLEDAFNSDAVRSLEKEYEWLKTQIPVKG